MSFYLKLFAILFAAISNVLSIHAEESGQNSPRDFRIVGYLPDYRQLESDQADFLTDLIVFSAEPTDSASLDLTQVDRLNWEQLRTIKTKHGIRLILCIGGWNRSTNFASVTNSKAQRQTLVDNIVRVCLERRLDGIDLDWEHPKNEQEQENYAQLIFDLRSALKPHGMVLTLTMAAWQNLPQKAYEAVDWIQLMAYDHPGKHSTFDAVQSDIQKLLDQGVPKKKITLGLPFYARDQTNPERVMTYREVVSTYHPREDVDELDNFYFNGKSMIRRKTQLALDQELAGVMFWELGQDAAGEDSLLRVIHSTVN